MTPSIVGNLNNSSAQEYPPDEWRITGELIRQIGRATTWQRIIEAGDALMTVSRIAKSMRDERDHHAQAKAGRSKIEEQICLGGHRWLGTGQDCCPQCNRRPSASGQYSIVPNDK